MLSKCNVSTRRCGCWISYSPPAKSRSTSRRASREPGGARDGVDGGREGCERERKVQGCDIVDVSTGQTVPYQRPRYGRQFQTPFADRIRHEVRIATMAVGNISSFEDVNGIIAAGRADLCLMARAHLWDPYWTRHAAYALGYPLPWPSQYETLDNYTPRFGSAACTHGPDAADE